MAENKLVADIRHEASLSSTYTRGCTLVRDGKVSSMDASEDPDLPEVVDVTGKVRGSTSNVYSVIVTLNLRDEYVYDYSCECPAHTKYSGMCKHSVALALAYLYEMGYEGVPFPPKSPFEPYTPAYGSSAYGTSAYLRQPPKPAAYTSPQIERLIADYAARSARELSHELPMVQMEGAAPEVLVELQCVISTSDAAWSNSHYAMDDTWALGFKVHRGKVNYIVKNVSDLVHAWQTGAMFKYGKRLEFAHRRSAFTEQSNELLEYVAGLVEAQSSLFTVQASRSGMSFYSPSPTRVPQKSLPISGTQLMEVLRIANGSKVLYEDYDYSDTRSYALRKVKRTLDVKEADPELEVALAPDDADSYKITVQPAMLTPIFDGTALALVGKESIELCSQDFSRSLGTFCDSVLPMRAPLKIREDDMPGFCAAVLPALRTYTNLVAPDSVDEYLPPAPEFSFGISLNHGIVECVAKVSYGPAIMSLFEEVREGQVVRDARREMEAQRVVLAFFPEGKQMLPDYAHPTPKSYHTSRFSFGQQMVVPPFFYEDDDEAYYLLFTEGLARLNELGEVMLSERLRGVTVRSAPSVRVDASVHSGLLDIEVISDDMTAQELMAYLASYRRKQRFVRLKDGDIVRLDGSVEAIADLANGLGVEPEDLVDGPQEVPANRTLFVDAMLKRAEGVQFGRNRAFRQIVRDFETVADADYTAPGNLRNVLRPYQNDGFKWLCTLGKAGFGGILADDMGLGKTLQLIAYLAHESSEAADKSLPEGTGSAPAPAAASPGDAAALGDAAAPADPAPAAPADPTPAARAPHKPSLVVCPASLVYNWQAEAERFAPQLEVACIVGPKPQRRSLIADAPSYDLLVTSYDLMRRDVEELAEQEFACVALDEAQYVKNSATKAAKAVRRLKADVRFALTGTPIENRLLELWSIFDFLMPGVLGSAESFSKRFSNPIGSGDEEVARSLRHLVGPFILRRNKRDVLRDLPEKSEAVVLANMEGEQEKLYKASATKLALSLRRQLPQEFAGSRIKVLAELTKLRQICCDPHLLYENYKGGSAKLETCMELVRQAIEGGHQLLLFSQFTSMLEIIGERLNRERIGWLTLTGATSKEQRVRLVERFQAGEAPVFLISLKAGGTGLNLTAADVVIHYDPWWNLAAQNQATDRTHRIGQTREVSVFKLIAKGTIEEKIVAMQEAKQDLADSVLGGQTAASSTITRDDILALLDAATE